MRRFLRLILWTSIVLAIPAVLVWILILANTPRPDSTPGENDFDVSVLFVTNRGHEPDEDPGAVFNARRGKPRFGHCDVRFRPIPITDEVAERAPIWIPTAIRNVVRTEIIEPELFNHVVEQRLANDPEIPVVVYVHGYANSFARTCRMGAELQRMLGDDGVVIMFSWPSDANPAQYVADQVDVEWSVPDLALFLGTLRERSGFDRVRLLAHSLGSRGTLLALRQLAVDGTILPIVEHLVLLAPDLDAATFGRQVDRILPLAQRMTLYASDNDAPLLVSESLHKHPRLGQAGDRLVVLPGLETIDVTEVGRYHPTGHEYF